jgi:hypothetical protein
MGSVEHIPNCEEMVKIWLVLDDFKVCITYSGDYNNQKPFHKV